MEPLLVFSYSTAAAGLGNKLETSEAFNVVSLEVSDKKCLIITVSKQKEDKMSLQHLIDPTQLIFSIDVTDLSKELISKEIANLPFPCVYMSLSSDYSSKPIILNYLGLYGDDVGAEVELRLAGIGRKIFNDLTTHRLFSLDSDAMREDNKKSFAELFPSPEARSWEPAMILSRGMLVKGPIPFQYEEDVGVVGFCDDQDNVVVNFNQQQFQFSSAYIFQRFTILNSKLEMDATSQERAAYSVQPPANPDSDT
jgi:hypothetical protein